MIAKTLIEVTKFKLFRHVDEEITGFIFSNVSISFNYSNSSCKSLKCNIYGRNFINARLVCFLLCLYNMRFETINCSNLENQKTSFNKVASNGLLTISVHCFAFCLLFRTISSQSDFPICLFSFPCFSLTKIGSEVT
jgi:hypothetical protein